MNYWVMSLLCLLEVKKSWAYKEDFDFTGLTPFPEGFIFSTATASYQVEGAWNVSGKGENIWDRITHTNPNYIVNGDNGDIACDSYHKFREDILNIKKIGFKMYRFSLSWSRLFPTGLTSSVNQDGVNYYTQLIDELLQNGIEPMVTIYHWDLPQPLEDSGGWLNANIVGLFAEYARAVFKLFGNKVKWWITINEPICVTQGYGSKSKAPALDLHGVGEYTSAHNLIKAHAKAYTIYRNEFKKSQKGKVSIAINGPYFFPKDSTNASHIEAAERAFQFSIGWFAHPIFSKTGDYPSVMREFVDKSSQLDSNSTSRLPKFTEEEIKEIKGTYDFFALNHYSSYLAEPGTQEWAPDPSVTRDQRVITSIIPGSLKSECTWLRVTPEGFGALLKKIKEDYDNPDIFVTENGYCDSDKLVDIERMQYTSKYLLQLLEAIKIDGCRVIGYTVWSLMDNFEWNDGYTKKFGIIRVDFNDPQRTRTWKSSASFFQQLININSVKLSKTEL